MAIREPIIVDPTKGIKGLDEMNRATMKYARKQERHYKQNQKAIQAIEDELQKLRRVREASSNPEAVRKYTNTIEKLEKEQRQLRQETAKYEKAVQSTGKEVQNTSKKSQSAFKKIGRSAKLWIAGAVATALTGLRALLRRGVDLAQSIEETASKYETVLGPSIQKANKFIDENATLMGLSNRQAQDMVATTTAIAQGFGYTGERAADLGLEVVKLAGDMQSFHDVPIARTHNAITSALSGETEALKSLGIVIRQEMVTQRAMNDTGKESVDALTQQERATATLALITEKAGVAIGDLERTQNSASNRSRQVRANILDIAESLSVRLLPAIDSGLTKIEPLVGQLKDWAEIRLSDELQAEQSDLNVLVGMITDANIAQDRRNELIKNLQADYPGFLKNLDAEKVTNEQLADRLADVNDEYIRRIGLVSQQEDLNEAISDQAAAYRRIHDIRRDVVNRAYELNRAGEANIQIQGQSTEAIIDAISAATNLGNTFITGGVKIATWRGRLKMAKDEVAEFDEAIKEERQFLRSLEEQYGLTADQARDMGNETTAGTATLEEQKETLEMVLSQLEKGTEGWEFYRQKLDEVNEALGSSSGSGSGFLSEMAKVWSQFQSRDMTDILLPKAEINETLHLVTQLDDRLSNIGEGDVIGAQMRGAAENVRKYNEALTKANNLRDAGAISQQEYEQRVKDANDAFLSQVQEIYKTIKDELTPAQQEMFEEMFGNFEDATEGGEDFKTNLDDIADTADAIINVADAFGAIGDNARKSLRGISDVLRNVQKIKDLQSAGDLTALSGAMPAIGAAGGILSIISGLAGNSGMSSEELADLRNEMKSLVRALDRNTDAILEQALIGADVSRSQLESAETILSELQGIMDGGRYQQALDYPGNPFNIGYTQDLVQNQLPEIFDRLAETGIEAFQDLDAEGFRTILDGIAGEHVGFDELDQALQGVINGIDDFEGISDVIAQLEESLGQFGDSIEGAIERMEVTMQLGMDPAAAFDTFIQDVIGLIGEDNEATKLLQQIAEAESPEGRKDLANELWEAFQESPELLGSDLTGSDLQEIIDVILDQADGASGSSGSEYSRSTQVANSITEIQANEMIMFLERIEAWTRATAKGVGADTSGMGFSVPGAKSKSNLSEMKSEIANMSRSKTNNISIGDVNVSSNITDSEIDDILNLISRELKQRMRGQRF